MQIHEIQPKNKLKKKKRIGRGGKRGTYSGRGVKGQKARAGTNTKPIVRELLKRYPKLRGYQFLPLKKVSVVNISVLDKVFEDGAKIDPKTLKEKGLVRKSKKNEVKILGNGETKKKFFVSGCMVSQTAKEVIEKAGGSVPQDTKKEERELKKEKKIKKAEKKKENKKEVKKDPKKKKDSKKKKTK